MDTRLWCRVLVLSVCAQSALAADNDQIELSDIAVVSRDEGAPTVPTTEITALATTDDSDRRSRLYHHEREGFEARGVHEHDDEYQDEEVEHDHHHQEDTGDKKAMSQAKADYWGGYYDFLINEGSYKFWAVFQLATAALLIYSGFAALYYAKVNPPSGEDYEDDFFRRRRRRRSLDRYKLPRDRPYYGLEPQIFQRILDAIAREIH